MPLSRTFASVLASVALAGSLAIALAYPENEVVLCLQDQPSSSIEAELARSEARGYYESLLDQSAADSDRPETDTLPEDTPPPGWSTFADSGALDLDPGYIRWRLKPDLDLAWNATRIRTNHLGARSPEIRIPKPANTFRVVVLGSSNTMGHGVDDEDIYVRRLERWLDSLKWPDGLRVEVVNLAVSSDAPSQRLFRLQHDVPPLQPDWIVCDATVLDISLEELHLEATRKNQTPIPFAYVRQAIQKAGISSSDDPESFSTKLRTVYEPLLDGAWAGWAEESRRMNVPLTVVLLPRADAKGRAPRIEALFHTLAQRHDLDLIDLSASFDDLTADQFRVSAWDQHPSVFGHLVLFEALKAAIEARGGPPGLPISPNPYLEAPARRARVLSGNSRS